MKKTKSKKTTRDKIWRFMGTNQVILIVTLILAGSSVILPTYNYLFPQPSMYVFFDPAKSTDEFSVSNLGNQPLTNVKISYALDCQKINSDNEYIRKDIPILSPAVSSDSKYIHNFDNRTSAILKFYYQHHELCINGSKTESEFDIFDFFFNSKVKETDVIFCDNCNLIMTVTSDQEEKSVQYNFTNPIRAKFSANITTFPQEQCQGAFGCNKVNIGFYGIDWWNSQISPKNIALRTDENIPPQKIFIVLKNSDK